jgi:hypothetical protein
MSTSKKAYEDKGSSLSPLSRKNISPYILISLSRFHGIVWQGLRLWKSLDMIGNAVLTDFDFVLSHPHQSLHYCSGRIRILCAINCRIRDILLDNRIVVMAESLLHLECRLGHCHYKDLLKKLEFSERGEFSNIKRVLITSIEALKNLILVKSLGICIEIVMIKDLPR